MACSSNVSLSGYECCQQTIKICKEAGFFIAKDSPLDRCLSLIRRDILDGTTFPVKEFTELPLPEYSDVGKKHFLNLLKKRIPFGESSVKPLKLLLKVKANSENKDWNYQVYLCGSSLPFYIDHPFLSVTNLTGSNMAAYSHNIDILFRVRLGAAEDARAQFEKELMTSIGEVAQLDFEACTASIKAIHSEGRWTIITVGNETVTLDLMILYVTGKDVFPELYTQHAYFLPIDELIHHGEQALSSLQPTTAGITSTMLHVDRIVNICRRYPCGELEENDPEYFRRITVLKTTGALGAQQGLEPWALSIYLHTPKKVQHVVGDARRSFEDHLPQTLGAFLAQWMHWMAAMSANEDVQQEMALALDYPVAHSEPDYLKKTYAFIKQHPSRFPLLLTIVEFSSLLGYLTNPEGLITCGMWEGSLTLRCPLDGLPGIYFQFSVDPTNVFERLIKFFEQNSNDNEVDIDAKALLQSYFEWFELSGPFELHPNALPILQNRFSEEYALEKIWSLLQRVDAPTVATVMDEIIELIIESEPAVVGQSEEVQIPEIPPKHSPMRPEREVDPFVHQLERLTSAKRLTTSKLKAAWTALKKNSDGKLSEITDSQWNRIFQKIESCRDFPFLWEALYKQIDIEKRWEPFIEVVMKKLLVRSGRQTGATEELKACATYLIPILDEIAQQIQWNRRVESVNDLGNAVLQTLATIKRFHPDPLLSGRVVSLEQSIIRIRESPKFLGISFSSLRRLKTAYERAKNSMFTTVQRPRNVPQIKFFGRTVSRQSLSFMFRSAILLIITFVLRFLIINIWYSVACSIYVDDTSSPGQVKIVPPAKFVDIIHTASFFYPEATHLINEIGHFLCIGCKCKLFAPEDVPKLLRAITEARR